MDAGVSDATGVGQLRGGSSQFAEDRHTPTPLLCSTWGAWQALQSAASDGSVHAAGNEPFTYDLVNTGREVLAQLSTPLSLNFSDATVNAHGALSASLVARTGSAYVELLHDLDTLVATDVAFLLGPWLESARAWGANASDCGETPLGPRASCSDVYEWQARAQLTTWYPPTRGAAALMPRDGDYARKQWSGLIRDYYAQRVELLQAQALANAALPGGLFNATAWARTANELAVNFTESTLAYPTSPVGDAVAVSGALAAKYAPVFASCK